MLSYFEIKGIQQLRPEVSELVADFIWENGILRTDFAVLPSKIKVLFDPAVYYRIFKPGEEMAVFSWNQPLEGCEMGEFSEEYPNGTWLVMVDMLSGEEYFMTIYHVGPVDLSKIPEFD